MPFCIMLETDPKVQHLQEKVPVFDRTGKVFWVGNGTMMLMPHFSCALNPKKEGEMVHRENEDKLDSSFFAAFVPLLLLLFL